VGVRGGADLGRRALPAILGDQEIESSIEWYLALRPGFELVRSVLNVLESECAMGIGYRIATADPHSVRRRAAVELLRGFATAPALPWVQTFLESQDTDVQNWGVSLLDQLLFRRAVEPEQAESYISQAERHPNPLVRAAAETIRKDIAIIS